MGKTIIGRPKLVLPKYEFAWIIDLNIRPKPLGRLEENLGLNLHDLELGKVF